MVVMTWQEAVRKATRRGVSDEYREGMLRKARNYKAVEDEDERKREEVSYAEIILPGNDSPEG